MGDKSPHLTIDMDNVEELNPTAGQDETDKPSGSESSHQIIEIKEAPTEEEQPEKNTQNEEENAPNEEENAPNEEENAPNEQENAPTEDENAPNEQENAPTEDENAPNEEENVPNEQENAPTEDENAPNENASNEEENAPNEDEKEEEPSASSSEEQSNENKEEEENKAEDDAVEKPDSPHHTVQIDEVEEFKPEETDLTLEVADLEEMPEEVVNDEVEPFIEADVDVPGKTPTPGPSSSRLSKDILVENLEVYSQSSDNMRPRSVIPSPVPIEESPDQEASRFMVMLVAWLCMCEANLPPESFTQLMNFPTLKLLLSLTSSEQQELVRKMFTNHIGDEKIPKKWDRQVKKLLRGYDDERRESIDESMIMEEAFD